jgi:hypothetical protein
MGILEHQGRMAYFPERRIESVSLLAEISRDSIGLFAVWDLLAISRLILASQN